jgi:hypothetical protein
MNTIASPGSELKTSPLSLLDFLPFAGHFSSSVAHRAQKNRLLTTGLRLSSFF